MTEEQIEQATNLFKEKLIDWDKDEGKNINAYEYEKRYVESMQDIEKEVLQIIVGSEAKSRNSKKKFKQV